MDSDIKNDLNIDPKNLAQTGWSTLGDLLGTPWGPSWLPGPEIDDSRRGFYSIFESQSIKSESNSAQNRRSEHPRSWFRAILQSLMSWIDLDRSRSFKTTWSDPKSMKFIMAFLWNMEWKLKTFNQYVTWQALDILRKSWRGIWYWRFGSFK